MKKRILSVLLCLVMVLGLLPATALAEGGSTHPTAVSICNSAGTTISLQDKGYLATNTSANAATGWTDAVTNYVARYDANTGTLYLNNYTGKIENHAGSAPRSRDQRN